MIVKVAIGVSIADRLAVVREPPQRYQDRDWVQQRIPYCSGHSTMQLQLANKAVNMMHKATKEVGMSP